MTLPTPPRYVVIPEDVIEQAFMPDKPRRALLGSFVRILSLAWEAKYQKTPMLNEEELMAFLKLSRRQYFEQKADMELVGWLRSSHPRPGFVQFTFSRSISEKVAGAENPEPVQKTAPLKRIEEEDSLEIKDSESSSSSSVNPVRKTARTASEQKMQALVENLRLAFDPEDYGLLEWREAFCVGIPERVLGWIAKAYQDRKRLGSPIGLIVKHITLQDAPDRHYLTAYTNILPEAYLDAVGETEYGCDYCDGTFGRRDALHEHLAEMHPHRCHECSRDFRDDAARLDHFHRVHENGESSEDPGFQVQADISVTVPIDGGRTAEQAWQVVLAQLQTEMPRASFDTWVRDTKAVRYDGNALQIGVRNAYARDWLESRLESTARRLLVGILNRSVEVEFVVAETAS